MSHPILGLELEELQKRSRHYLMHVGDSDQEFSLDLCSFFATQWRNPRVLQAVAELFAGIRPTGEG